MVRKRKLALSLALLTVTISVGLLAGGTSGAPPVMLCGWEAVWTCTLPSGEKVEVTGTVCDIRRYEKATGATCEF